MSAERGMRNSDCGERQRRATRFRFVLHPSAFTLIEMLTVIAIIGILAAILLPTLRMVQARARMAQAGSDVSALAQALTVYSQDFGAFPPDSNSNLDSTAFSDMNMPNECLVWFLTREYSKDATVGTPNHPSGPWPINPQDALKINARITATSSPYHDIRTKARRDYDNDGFYEFVDPWGRPYLYRAYLDAPGDVDSASLDLVDAKILILDLDVPAELQRMQGILGKIRLRGVADNAFNGDFDFEGQGDDLVRITFSSALGAAPDVSSAEYQFLLHNRQTCDIYSLGPDGLTRGAKNPNDGTNIVEWKPQVSLTDYDRWKEVWGSPGDGNDVLKDGNVGIANEKNRDDINNW